MWTDGVACSFVCRKHKSLASPKKLTPTCVPMERAKRLIALDPGMTNLATCVVYDLKGNEADDDAMAVDEDKEKQRKNQKERRKQQQTSGNQLSMVKVTGAEWHDGAGHHSISKR